MERQIPKNVRQIGNVSDTPKVYVEDYVDTFLAQLCDKAGEVPMGAFLIGDLINAGEEEYVYIYGAVQMHELKVSGNEYILEEAVWKAAYEDCKQYFEDGEMLGWFVANPGVPLTVGEGITKLHRKAFPKNNTIFILKDPIEQEEKYFVHKFHDLMELGGHFTYYEKNPCMQNYMISSRKKNGVCPSETVEDRAAKDFRSLVRAREQRQGQRRTSRLMYAMSACLVLLVVIMGVAMLNNFDRMKAVKSVIDEIGSTSVADVKAEEIHKKAEEMDKKAEEEEKEESIKAEPEAVKETSGNVTAIVEEKENPTESVQSPEVKETKAEDTGQTGGVSAQSAEPDYNGKNGVYVVEEGDTLAMISKKIYGDLSHTDAICKMNGLADGNLIYVGQKLLLP